MGVGVRGFGRSELWLFSKGMLRRLGKVCGEVNEDSSDERLIDSKEEMTGNMFWSWYSDSFHEFALWNDTVYFFTSGN